MSAHVDDLRRAQRVLDPSDYICWLLNERRMSQRNIALALDLSRTTVRDRISRAHKTLADEKELER